MMIPASNAVAAWIYLWMTFQLGFFESTDLLPRVSKIQLSPADRTSRHVPPRFLVRGAFQHATNVKSISCVCEYP